MALMGSTGRATGPHVQFEILRDGNTVNPANFVKR
jgi:murein DD-endopeptidase MepM/ murein hydrolase activator NlpD